MPLPENSLINPQSMLQDNHSEFAGRKIDKILELRANGQLMVVWGCSDARLILPDDVYQVRTIAGTGPRSPWANLLNYDRSSGVVIMDHLYCGGIQAKAQLPETLADEDTALGFVKDHVWAVDPIVQSILTGSWTASRTKRSVMSAVQNPLDGKVYPQGIFNNGSQTEHKTLPTYKLMPKRYVPEELYGEKVPLLSGDLIPESFTQVLKRIKGKVELLRLTSPEIFALQPIQDPEVVAVTTNLKPLSARFPALFGEPNTVFQVSLRRQSLDEEGDLKTKDVTEALKQVQYPISHTIEHKDKQGRAPFKSVTTLYLETGDMKVSQGLARQAEKKPWVQEWLELPGRTIIVAEVIKGRITQIEKVV